jgi:hypothetical protein
VSKGPFPFETKPLSKAVQRESNGPKSFAQFPLAMVTKYGLAQGENKRFVDKV